MSNSYNMKDFSSTAVITENGVYSYPSSISIYTINTKCKDKNDSEKNDYDPFQNRKLEHPNSDMRSFANLLKSSLGSGILAMPAAFKNSGTIVGIFGTIILGYICTHCVYLLVKTSQEVSRVSRVPSLGYAETVEAVFATGPRPLRKLSRAARIFIDWTMAFTILGACAVYVILLKDSVKQIVDHFVEGSQLNETIIDPFGAGYGLNQTIVDHLLQGSQLNETIVDAFGAGYGLNQTIVDQLLQGSQLNETIVDHFKGGDQLNNTAINHMEYSPLNENFYYLIFLVPLLIFTQIKNLKYLAPFSGFANFLLVATFAICLYYVCDDFPDLSTLPTSVDIGKLPLFIGTVIFAMEGIGVVLPVENTMAKPQHFLGCPGVLNITMTVVVLLYMIMGFLGYVKYGDDSKGSITLNLPTAEIPALMAKVFIILAIFFTYTLQFYVPMEIVWRNTKQYVGQKYHNHAQSIMRAVFATLTVIAAATLPRLEEVIGLEGAFFYSFLGLIAPSILDLIFNWERNMGKYNWILIKDAILILFGSFVLVTGVMQSIRQIISIYAK